MKPLKILIIRFSSIGDIVLTSPVVRCLYRQKNADIHFLTKTAFAQIPAANPMIRRVFALGKPSDADNITARAKLSELLPLLRAEGYDYVIDLHHNIRSWRVKMALQVPAFSFNKLNIKKWLLVRWGINILPDVHIVHRYLETVRSLGVVYDGAGLDFHVPPGTNIAASALFSETGRNQPFVAFVIGATHATKRLPDEKITAICQAIQRHVVLIGGPSERESGQRIAAAAGSHVTDTCGKFSLFESAEVIRQAEVVLTHDTGMMHIAAALGKRIVSVWGNTVPAFGMYPFYPDGADDNTTVEVNELKCRPCSKIGHNACPRGHFDCMNKIRVEQILDAISV